MPIVVVADSGRMAKWIATECKLTDYSGGGEQKLTLNPTIPQRLKLKEEIRQEYPNKVDEITRVLRRIVKERRNFVSITLRKKRLNTIPVFYRIGTDYFQI